MAVTKEQAGTYRQVAHILRFRRASGKAYESARPRDGRRGNWGAFQDSDDKPTLVKFGEGDQVDLDLLLKSGAIAPYTPPKPKASEGTGKSKEGGDGKASR